MKHVVQYLSDRCEVCGVTGMEMAGGLSRWRRLVLWWKHMRHRPEGKRPDFVEWT